MKCLMLEFEAVKQGEFRAVHPFWQDDGGAMDIVVKLDSSGETWGVYFESSVLEDDIESAEHAMWAAACGVIREMAAMAVNELGLHNPAESVAAEHLLGKWQKAFDSVKQKAGV